jgi:hypothetical protein
MTATIKASPHSNPVWRLTSAASETRPAETGRI